MTDDEQFRWDILRWAFEATPGLRLEEAIAVARAIEEYVRPAPPPPRPAKTSRSWRWSPEAKEYLREAYPANVPMAVIKTRLEPYGVVASSATIATMASRLGVGRSMPPARRAALVENARRASRARVASRKAAAS